MKTFFKITLTFFVILGISLGILGYTRFRTPTTAQMKDFFSANRVAFEHKNKAILALLSQNSTINSGSNAEIGYKWLEIEPDANSYQNGEPIIIRYYTHLRGIGTGSFGTGIAYLSPATEQKIYPGLDAMADDAANAQGFVGYSHIKDSWYSFFWRSN